MTSVMCDALGAGVGLPGCGAAKGLVCRKAIGVDFDASKSDDWQVAYMRMVAEACRAVAGGSGFGLGRFYDGVDVALVDGDVVGVGGGYGDAKSRFRHSCGVGCVWSNGGSGCGLDESEVVDGGSGGTVGELPVLGVHELETVSGESSRALGGCASCSDGGNSLGSTGSVDSTVGVVDKKAARREKNRRRKNNRKERKNGESGGCPVPEWRRGASAQPPVSSSSCGQSGVKRGFFSDLSEEQRVELQASRAALLVKQNKLAAQRADRELEVLMATDIEAEKRRQSTKLRAAIERNMVSIEKTHATLIATDNVKRDELDHDVHTVVTDGVPSLSSGSISPNSSASMAEYRAVQKQLLDEQKKLSDKEVETEKLYAVLKKIGIEPGVVDYLDKDMWTINSQGTLDDDAKVALEVLAPEGYVIPGQAYVSKGDKVTIRAL